MKVKKSLSLLSIVIPTYNGESTLKNLLTNLSQQIVELDTTSVSIVINDDCSHDNTSQIADSFSKKYSFINSYKNQKNLGMDLNFLRTASLAQGKFIWFMGQDDEPLPDAIKIVYEILNKDQEAALIYANYSQYDQKKRRIITSSMLNEESFAQSYMKENIHCFADEKAFLKHYKDFPSFLPATVTKKEFLFNDQYTEFIGTHFVQYAAVALNSHRGNIYTITKVIIKGLIPEKGWQKNGALLFSVMIGKMRATTLIYQHRNNPFPRHVFDRITKEFIFLWPKLLLHTLFLGLPFRIKWFKTLKTSTLLPNFFVYVYFLLPLLVGLVVTYPFRKVRYLVVQK